MESWIDRRYAAKKHRYYHITCSCFHLSCGYKMLQGDFNVQCFIYIHWVLYRTHFWGSNIWMSSFKLNASVVLGLTLTLKCLWGAISLCHWCAIKDDSRGGSILFREQTGCFWCTGTTYKWSSTTVHHPAHDCSASRDISCPVCSFRSQAKSHWGSHCASGHELEEQGSRDLETTGFFARWYTRNASKNWRSG